MNEEYRILRELGKKAAEIANLPVQKEKQKLWTLNNDLTPVRPMVYMDQLPWHELQNEENMRLLCKDPFLRFIETELRRTLYRWHNFRCDMVVENRINIPHNISGLNYGIHIKEEIQKTDDQNDIVSHAYIDQLNDEQDLEKLQYDKIQVDRSLDEQHMEIASEIFYGILPVRFSGVQIHSGVWDRIAQMRPAEAILWDLADRPEFTEKIVRKFVDLTMNTVDQCEQLGLLDEECSYVHCTGAYTNDLPKDRSEKKNHSAVNVWSFGMAQLFSSVSPAMHEEYEIDLVKPLYERFGLLYYGCCEPLENKIDLIRKINNVRKISISPWAKPQKAAERIGRDYVLSLKSNPAFIASGIFEKDLIEKQISEAVKGCRENGCPLEIILKDVSTTSRRPEVLRQWSEVVMKIAESW